MQVRQGWKVSLWLLATSLAFACGGRTLSPPPADPDPLARTTYVIGIQDLLSISVWKNDELNVRVPVRPDGKISVPLVDDVQAEGLTVMELKDVLTHELSEFITAPDVTVVVMEMRSKAVNLIGAVMRTGRIPMTHQLRVLDAIVMMGGFSQFADKSDVQIVRSMPDGSEQAYRFDYNAYTKGKAPGSNIVLHDGDTIIVSE
jgi:polysaccharide export outer membrane protein